ncbi:MAG TPA: hypothetical protein VK569_09775 [Bacteroidota bacterium]|nr:hypothetical protein [Bacteroidota bacterium]
MKRRIVAVIVFACVSRPGIAGPPFKTDDPQPVDFRHWEFYLASQGAYSQHATDATLPHIEINFGAFENVQLHVVAPMAFVSTSGAHAYGYSDTELGAKYRFVDESDSSPQIGVFPLVELPTGNAARDLGGGSVQAYLPLWIQKSWGNFTTYGGAGFWYNPGTDNQNWMFAGWEAQYDLSSTFTVGGEFYYQTADKRDGTPGTGFNVGGYINLSENDHILISLGRSFQGDNIVTGYLGFQYTI